MSVAPRRLRAVASLVVVLVAAVAIAVTAIRADGRPASREDTNDGGAWLLDRQASAIGHVNRASREVSGVVRVAEPGSTFWVDQSGPTVLVHDESTRSVSVVDGRSFASTATVPLELEADVAAVEGEVVVSTDSPLRVWRLPLAEFTVLEDALDGVEATVEAAGPGLATTTPSDTTIAVGADGATTWLHPDGSTSEATLPLDDDLLAVTALGDDAVAVTGDTLVTAGPAAEAVEPVELGALPDDVVWQQPGLPAPHLVGTGADGSVVAVDRADGSVTDLFRLEGTDPVPPIVHGGCTFALVSAPAVFARQCGDDVLEVPLEGVSTGVLEMRLVNGWVWINAVDTGEAWVIDQSSGLEEVDDLGDTLEDDEEALEEEVDDADSSVQRQDNDADDTGQADQLDDDAINEPPVANPDEVSGRSGQPLLVQVLRNDLDPDGDVMLVTQTQVVGGEVAVTPTADRTYVQVTPVADFVGAASFEYTVEDGRGGRDSTTVTVDVRPDELEGNRPPVAETDVVAAAPAVPASANVLDNDLDPDGDSLQLVDITGDGVGAVWSPDGKVTLTPDQSVQGEVTMEYVVADGWGAEATGTVRLDVRTVDEANRPPDARNDAATTAVGNPIVMRVLDNDLDPDGDRITVGGAPVPVTVPNGAADVFTSLSPDGVFFLDPEVPGDYVFRYQVSDGGFSDVAQIRVRVNDSDGNRPPIAVRDDAVIPLGGTRVVQALRNDGDPDGDVLGIVGWTGSSGLVAERIDGVGFRVTVLPSAAPVERFTYEISDGVNESVFGTVVVTVSEASGEDQLPVATPDVVEVQAGRAVAVPVLRNDYDPEGGALQVTSVVERDDAELTVGGGGQSVLVTLPADAEQGFDVGYTIADDAGNAASSTIEVQVVLPDDENRPPIAVPDVVTTLETAPIVLDVLANDTDPDGDALQLESITEQPANGNVRILDDGTVEYEAVADVTGTDRFSYAVVDSRGARVIGRGLVGVMPRPDDNRPPIAVGDEVELEVGAGQAVVDVLANDLDPDGDRLIVTDVSDAGLGEVAVSEDSGAVLYTPPDALEPDEERVEVAFRYSVDDGAGHTVDSSVRVLLLADRDPLPPIANDDRAGPVQAGERVVVDVLDNDLDPDGDPDELEVSSDADGVRVRPDGALAITTGDITGQYVYRVTDGDDLEATAAVTVVVVDNQAPTVDSRTVETAFETPVEVDLTGAAVDPDDDELRYVCCDQVRAGSVDLLSADATSLRVRFTPNPDFSGEAGFAFTVDDQAGHVVAANVVVDVEPPSNTPPVVADTSVDAEVGRTTTVDLAALVEDADPDDEHEFSVGQSSGPFTVRRSGERVIVEPEITATGASGSFVLTATDAAGESASGTVTMDFAASSLPPPVATDDAAETTQGVEVAVPVLRNDIGDGLEVLDASTRDGSVSVQGDRLVFDPDPDFFGTGVVTYTIGDEQQTQARQATAQVRVGVVGFPGRPAAPRVAEDSREATLTWTAPPANGAAIERYEVEHDQGGSEQVGTATTHQWTRLTNGTAYRFRVRAVNQAGPSEWSDWSPAVVPNQVPGRPASPSATFGNTELDVTWRAPSNEGTAITTYELEIGGSATGSRSIPPGGATTQHTWEGLRNGSEYQFRVRAVNDAGNSPWSSWSASEHPLTEPDAPTVPSVETGPTHLDIRWNRPSDGGDTIQSYQVQRRRQGDDSTTTARRVDGANSTSYRWGELPSGTYFEFRVRATNRADSTNAGWSGWSEPQRACAPPATPSAPGTTRGDRQADVRVSVPDERCTIDDVEFQHDQGSATYSFPSGSGTVTSLSNGTAYRFRARFTNEQRTGSWGPWSAAVTPAGPARPPSSLSVSAVTGVSGSMALDWNAGQPNGSPITEYGVFVDGARVATKGGAARTHTVTGLTPGRSYTFAVSAANDVGSDGRISRTGTARGAPSAIGSLNVNNTTRGELTWNWNAPAGNGGGIDYYQVDRNASGSNLLRTTNRSHTWGGLGDGVTKEIRVRACNEFGCGGWARRAGTTKPPPPPDPTVRITKGSATGVREDCASGRCNYAVMTLRDFAPNTPYQRRCQFRPPGGSISYSTSWQGVTVNGAGDWGPNQIDCFFEGGFREMRIQVFRSGNLVSQSPWTGW